MENRTTKECHSCGKQFLGGPRAAYCPECRAIRIKEYRYNADRKKTGEIMICEKCGKETIRKSPSQRFCPECAKSKNNNKISISSYGSTKRKAVSIENPLNCDICDIFLKQFKNNISYLIDMYGADEISNVTGAKKITVFAWRRGDFIPTMKNILRLYREYGSIALPYITKNGVIERKPPIPASGSGWVAKVCASAGYSLADAAKAMGMDYVLFCLKYKKSNFKPKTAIELLYVFGIDDVIKYYDDI